MTSLRFNRCKNLSRNGIINIALLRDLTASNNYLLMRGRSLHTRGRAERLHQDSKGDSLNLKSQATKVLETKKVSDKAPSKVRVARKSDSFVTLVQKELLLCKNKKGVYNGLINILKKPEFLVACYDEIRGKPGNMTRGNSKETLDKLSLS